MNRIEDKEMATGAANYFKEEVLEIMPDITRENLCAMVGEYIYYQQDQVTRDEAHSIRETCLLK